jgi:hypothetical protein
VPQQGKTRLERVTTTLCHLYCPGIPLSFSPAQCTNRLLVRLADNRMFKGAKKFVRRLLVWRLTEKTLHLK